MSACVRYSQRTLTLQQLCASRIFPSSTAHDRLKCTHHARHSYVETDILQGNIKDTSTAMSSRSLYYDCSSNLWRNYNKSDTTCEL
jgi:hypothetical protein